MPAPAPKRRSPGRPTAEDRENLRWAILEAAAKAFSSQSYDDVSMEAIAVAANTSRQSIYARFPTKAALFTAFMAWQFQTQAAVRLEAPEERQLPPKEYLERLGLLLLQSNAGPEGRKMGEHLRTVIRHAPELAPSLWNNGPGRGRELLRTYFAEQVSQGTLKIADPETAMEQFLGLVVGGAVFRLSRGVAPLHVRKQEQRLWVESCVALFLSFYKGAAKPEPL